jgi:hypothetical protein
MNRHTILKLAWWTGHIMLLWTIVLQFTFPHALPDNSSFRDLGYHTPVLAEEFLRDTMEAKRFFLEGHDSFYDALRMGNRLDFVFMALYSLVLGLSLMYYIPGQRWAALLAVLVGLSDMTENISMFALEGSLLSQDWLSTLQWSTWTKWLGLYVIFTILASRLGRLSVLVPGLGAMFWLSWFLGWNNRGYMMEALAFLSMLFFVGIYISLWRSWLSNRVSADS